MNNLLLSALFFGSYFTSFSQEVQCEKMIVPPLQNPDCTNEDPWVLVFEDNFDGINVNQNKWVIPYQGILNDFYFDASKQWLANTGTTPSLPISNNIEVSDGSLKLIARREQPPIVGTAVTAWNEFGQAIAWQSSTFDFSSGWLETKKKFEYGKYEILCIVPKGHGFFPAFWTYGDPNKNEIDIFEFWNENNCLGFDDPNRLARNPHFNYHKEVNGVTYSCKNELFPQPCQFWNATDLSLTWHKYTMIWDPYFIAWFIDDAPVRTVYRYNEAVLWGEGINCPDLGNYMIYEEDLAFVDSYPQKMIVDFALKSYASGGVPDVSTPFPSEFQINYIRYYKRVECIGDVIYNNTSELGLSSTVYNVGVGNTITFQNNVSIPADQQLNLVSKSKIILKPGFQSLQGSVLNTKIDPSICGFAGLMANDESELDPVQIAETVDSETYLNTDQFVIKSNVRIYPNPTNDMVYVEFPSQNEFNDTYNVVLTDYSGRNLLSVMGNKLIELDLNGFKAGMYLITIYDSYGNEREVAKVIKN